MNSSFAQMPFPGHAEKGSPSCQPCSTDNLGVCISVLQTKPRHWQLLPNNNGNSDDTASCCGRLVVGIVLSPVPGFSFRLGLSWTQVSYNLCACLYLPGS